LVKIICVPVQIQTGHLLNKKQEVFLSSLAGGGVVLYVWHSDKMLVGVLLYSLRWLHPEPGYPNQYSCCFLQSFRKNCELHPSLYSVGIAGSLIGAKRPGREADYSPNLMLRFSSAPSLTLWRTQW